MAYGPGVGPCRGAMSPEKSAVTEQVIENASPLTFTFASSERSFHLQQCRTEAPAQVSPGVGNAAGTQAGWAPGHGEAIFKT